MSYKKIRKSYPQIGYCGIDCTLCPKYYTAGKTKCFGCCGDKFWERLRICSFITCSGKKNKFETCSQCKAFPCSKFDNFVKKDSFVTHRKVLDNLKFIDEFGLEEYLKQQSNERKKLLELMLEEFNEGRSKSYFCLAITLLEIEDVKYAINKSNKIIKDKRIESNNKKSKAKILKSVISEIAENKKIDLILRK